MLSKAREAMLDLWNGVKEKWIDIKLGAGFKYQELELDGLFIEEVDQVVCDLTTDDVTIMRIINIARGEISKIKCSDQSLIVRYLTTEEVEKHNKFESTVGILLDADEISLDAYAMIMEEFIEVLIGIELSDEDIYFIDNDNMVLYVGAIESIDKIEKNS